MNDEPSVHQSEALSRLMPLLRHATAHLGVEHTPTGKALGITNPRMMALSVLSARTACSMSDFSQELDLPGPLATRLADELVDRRLAVRDRDAADRRRVLLRITRRGREVLWAVHAEAEVLLSSVLGRMSEAETKALLTGLRAFLRVLHVPRADGVPPVLPEHGHDFATEEES